MTPPEPDESPRRNRFSRRKPEQAPADAPTSVEGPRVPPPATRPPGVRTAGEIAAEQEAAAKPPLPKAQEKSPAKGPEAAPQPEKPAKPEKAAKTEKPAKVAKPEKIKQPTSVMVRTRLAAALWAIAVICALVLAVAALLVALRANQDNAAVAAVLDGADLLDLGIFSRENGVFTFTGADAEVRSALVNWGLGAVAYLVLGKLLDRIIRP